MEHQGHNGLTADHHALGQNLSRARKFAAYKLMTDPLLRGKGFSKIYRYDGLPSDPMEAPPVLRDPRSRVQKHFAHKSSMDLPLPKFKIDVNYIGHVPPRELTFSNLNDNIDDVFLRKMCSKFGSLDEVKIYHSTLSGKSIGLGKAIFTSVRSARHCAEKLDQQEKMGSVMRVYIDTGGAKRKTLYDQLMRQEKKYEPVPMWREGGVGPRKLASKSSSSTSKKTPPARPPSPPIPSVQITPQSQISDSGYSTASAYPANTVATPPAPPPQPMPSPFTAAPPPPYGGEYSPYPPVYPASQPHPPPPHPPSHPPPPASGPIPHPAIPPPGYPLPPTHLPPPSHAYPLPPPPNSFPPPSSAPPGPPPMAQPYRPPPSEPPAYHSSRYNHHEESYPVDRDDYYHRRGYRDAERERDRDRERERERERDRDYDSERRRRDRDRYHHRRDVERSDRRPESDRNDVYSSNHKENRQRMIQQEMEYRKKRDRDLITRDEEYARGKSPEDRLGFAPKDSWDGRRPTRDSHPSVSSEEEKDERHESLESRIASLLNRSDSDGAGVKGGGDVADTTLDDFSSPPGKCEMRPKLSNNSATTAFSPTTTTPESVLHRDFRHRDDTSGRTPSETRASEGIVVASAEVSSSVRYEEPMPKSEVRRRAADTSTRVSTPNGDRFRSASEREDGEMSGSDMDVEDRMSSDGDAEMHKREAPPPAAIRRGPVPPIVALASSSSSSPRGGLTPQQKTMTPPQRQGCATMAEADSLASSVSPHVTTTPCDSSTPAQPHHPSPIVPPGTQPPPMPTHPPLPPVPPIPVPHISSTTVTPPSATDYMSYHATWAQNMEARIAGHHHHQPGYFPPKPPMWPPPTQQPPPPTLPRLPLSVPSVDPQEKTIDKAVTLLAVDLKAVMNKDLNRRMIENAAYKLLDVWYDDNEKSHKRSSTTNSTSASMGTTTTTTTSTTPSESTTTAPAERTTSLSQSLDRLESSQDISTRTAWSSVDPFRGQQAAGGFLGLRGAGFNKLPSFRIRKRPASPQRVDDDEARKESDEESDREERKKRRAEREKETKKERRTRERRRVYSSESSASSSEEEEDEPVEEVVTSKPLVEKKPLRRRASSTSSSSSSSEDEATSVSSSDEEFEESTPSKRRVEESEEEAEEDVLNEKEKEEPERVKSKLEALETNKAEDRADPTNEPNANDADRDEAVFDSDAADSSLKPSADASPVNSPVPSLVSAAVDSCENAVPPTPTTPGFHPNAALTASTASDLPSKFSFDQRSNLDQPGQKLESFVENQGKWVSQHFQHLDASEKESGLPKEIKGTSAASSRETNKKDVKKDRRPVMTDHDYSGVKDSSSDLNESASEVDSCVKKSTDAGKKQEPNVVWDHAYCLPPADPDPPSEMQAAHQKSRGRKRKEETRTGNKENSPFPTAGTPPRKTVKLEVFTEWDAQTVSKTPPKFSEWTSPSPAPSSREPSRSYVEPSAIALSSSRSEAAAVARLLSNKVAARPLPKPIYKPRSLEEELKIFYDFLVRGIDAEDTEFLHRVYEMFLSQDEALNRAPWLNEVTWVPHCPTLVPDPTRKERRKERLILKHSTGSARSEGYYKQRKQDKTTYVTHSAVPTMIGMGADEMGAEEEAKLLKEKARSVALISREARSNQRRYASVLGDDFNELFKFSQLKLRKKHLRFARSQIHDWGLFALEPIAPEEMIIEYTGEVIRLPVADMREKKYGRQGIGSSYFFRVERDTVIDATKFGNLARFINHCCDPTCYAKVISVEGAKKIVIYSKVAIDVNEEITYDYKFPIEEEKIKCLCGAINCRGFLN